MEDHVPLKSWFAVLGAALGAFMAVLDIQIVNSSLANIQGTLGATLDEGTWIATSYLVAEVITIPLTPWLSRIFSTRLYVITNACLFILFSVCCAWAWDLNSMIMFRALQGFTGGTLIPMALNIILTSLPLSKRPVGMAIFSVTATFAPSIGPAIGGWLTDTFSWQYIFYLNIIPGAILVAILLWALPKEAIQFSELKRGDWLGIASMALGLGALEIVLEEGNRKDWFGSELIVKLAVIAAVSLTVFLIHELRTKQPLVNLRLLARRNFGIGSVANVILGFGLYGSVYLLPVYLTQIQNYDSLQIGQVLVWMGLPQLLIIPLVPILMKRFDPRLLLGSGLLLFAISSLMNAFMTHDHAGPQLIASLLVRAIGQPLIMVPLSTITTGGIEIEQVGSASALFNMMRNLGGSIGIALISTFLTQREHFHSSRIGESISLAAPQVQDRLNQLTQMFLTRGADAATAYDQALRLIDSIVRKESFVMAFNEAFLVMGITIALCFATVFILKRPSHLGETAAH
ncbi:MAG: DHA2 family efflux MFS transporter permease subunit [Candidatus Obscuribacterales bacterium]|nr:DHA2 family efflux MFS transporter permease subunit [Candidatus Obscuribacterales bacterium]